MSEDATLEAIETLELVVSADNARTSTDSFKLPATGATSLRQTVNARLADLLTKTGATAVSSGTEAGAQVTLRRAVRNLEIGHRAGYRWLAGQLPDSIPAPEGETHMSEAQRAQLLESYGFAGGIVGDFTDTRTLDLARQAPIAAAIGVANPAWHYPAALLSFLATELTKADAAQMPATGGETGSAIEARNVSRELAVDIIARVRFFYCAASDMGDRTPELRKIGMQPRRLPGEAQPAPLPDAPGTVTHDAVAHTLSVAALPAHATSLRAYRQVLGGTPVLAGTSTTTTVSYAAASPLEEGATYEVWLAGHNAEGDGATSEHFTVVG